MMPNLRSVQLVRGRGGYGFTLSGEAPCYVSWIAEASAAEAARLRRGDFIITLNGENVYNASHEHVVKLIGISTATLSLEIQENNGADFSSSDEGEVRAPTFTELHNKRRAMHKPPYRPHSRPTVKEDSYDFNRTKQVLSELKSGALFQSMLSAIDSNSYDVDSSTASSKSSHSSRTKPKQQKHRSRDHSSNKQHIMKSGAMHGVKEEPSHRRNLSTPIESNHTANFNTNSSNNVFVQSIVAYLGTVEIAIELSEDIPYACLAAVEACVLQLRQEQHIHQRVLLKVTQACVKLFNADGDMIAVYDGRQICFSSSCPDDNRFFCIATSHGENQIRCHQFMVDPDICAHHNHVEKARRFGIHCSMDTETGNCLEFPKSPRIILKMVEALFDLQDNKPTTNGEAIQTPLINGIEKGDMSATSVLTTDSGIDGVNGSALRMQNHIQQYISNKVMKKEAAGSKLSQQNLRRHDMKSSNGGISVDGHNGAMGHLPPSMQKMSVGKYRGGAGTLPIQRGSSSARNALQDSRTQEVRQSKRGKKGNKNGEGVFFRVPKRSSSRQLRLNIKNVMSKSSESIPLSETGNLSAASSIESLTSNVSLPSSFNGVGSGFPIPETAGRVSNWSISFDRMLQGPMGLKYFTEFLRKEFSQENILFWLECEKLRKTDASDTSALKELADSIYERFLSAQATSPVNIDSKGQRLSDEALTKPPHPDMFNHQQNQIYKLMKLDSYSRFLKSSLYRQCLVCQIEGTPLPLEPEAQKHTQNETQIESRHSFSFKHRRFFAKKSWKSQGSNDSIHRKSSSDSESGFIEAMANSTRPEDTSTAQQVGADTSLICRLVLWDGSSTVLYAETGKATIREALNALCERRGVPLSAVDIYYQNEDRALALDQDVSVLAGQEVRVERRTLFRLDLLPIGRSVGVKAKPSKSTGEVLKPVVSKYGLEFDDLQTRLSGEKELLDLSQPVNILDGLRVSVDYTLEKSQDFDKKASRKSKNKLEEKHKQNLKSPTPESSDTEDLINIMSAVQSRKMHDQRGLLSEINLELPEFLKKNMTPSPVKQPVEITNGSTANNNNNNNNNKGRLDLSIPTTTNGYPVDVPMTKGSKLSPNPVGTGNAKARIQKLKYLGADTRSSPVNSPFSKTLRSKTPSLDNDILNDCDTDTLSAIDDDPYVISKWMQSVSCTPKYPYATNLDNTFSATSPTNVLTKGPAQESGLDFDGASSSGNSSVAHDHRYTYTRRKSKGIIV